MTSNFEFLEKDFPVLSNFGRLAEQYCYSDPNSCLMKLGMIGETIVNLIFGYDKLPLPADNTAAARIDVLKQEGLIDWELSEILHSLRRVRNKAVHENLASVSKATALLPMTYSLCEWFMQTYGDWEYQHRDFVMPVKQTGQRQTDEQTEKAREEALVQQAQQTAVAAASIPSDERKKKAQQAASQRQKTEAETRYMIDEQLRQVGWEADTGTLRHSKGTRPQKGRNLAIAEWPTDSSVSKKGYADYALFIGLQMVGIIEAKAEHKDIPSVIDYQGKDYPRNIRQEDARYQIGSWGDYKVPFTFATNGRPYLEQYSTKSGIWFLDLREPSNAPKALRGWFSPQGLQELLEKDTTARNQELQELPYDVLQDKNGLSLYDFQLRAVQAAEKAVIEGRQNILLAMATGTGKTRTVLAMIYRFLTTNRFQHILFLVDRTSLGEQAMDTFKDIKLEDLMTLDNIYNISGLTDKLAEKETRLHIATVQSMVKRILYSNGEDMPSVSDYDLVIIDEAHRGYILDKEMDDAEILFRDQRDYQSKYRSVIEYFDAVRIALTATPALQTTQIFGEPVFKYTYREAVIEGYLVDHDAPHHLDTALSTEGIHYAQGDKVTIYDPVTGEITNSELLEDELDFEIDQFNRQVITRPFNEVVLKEISQYIDPENPEEQGKTLIFAVDDQHADMIVDILKKIYSETVVDNDAIMKITGSVGGGNPKKVQQAIKRFKNERYPSIAVTVDLLTTGIDVPEICNLVFMRRVKSRILFEQMMGRATRLCPRIHKTHFEIYDPVRVYDSLEPVNTMKPVVTNPATTMTELVDGLDALDTEQQIENQINQIIAKLQRKKKNMSRETLEHFQTMTGGQDPNTFIDLLRRTPPDQARELLLKQKDLFKLIDQSRSNGGRPVVISNAQDKLLSHTRGYGKNEQRPDDYLDAFSDYVRSHMNEIAALKIICTRPRDLTRESLKELKLKLNLEGYTTQQLNTAISQLTNEEMAADIISLIRRYAIGSALISHEARIHQAVAKLKKAHNFSKQEQSWIGRMEQYLIQESVLNIRVFDEDSRFHAQGGFRKINKVFHDDLENIVLELNQYLYDDGGRFA